MGKNDYIGSRHHWVSQFILYQFELPKMPGQIYRYQRGVPYAGMHNPRRHSIVNTAQERDFNTLASDDGKVKTAELEKIIGDIETAAEPVIRKLWGGDINLSGPERSNLILYIAVLALSNPRTRRHLSSLLNDTQGFVEDVNSRRNEIVAGYSSESDLPDAEERMEKYIDNAEDNIKRMQLNPKPKVAIQPIMMAYDWAPELYKRKMELATATAPGFFIIGDHPVVALPPSDEPKDWEDRYWHLPLVFPISPDKAVHLIERDEPDEIKAIAHESVGLINHYSMFFAEDEVFSHANLDGIKEAFSKTIKGESEGFFVENKTE